MSVFSPRFLCDLCVSAVKNRGENYRGDAEIAKEAQRIETKLPLQIRLRGSRAPGVPLLDTQSVAPYTPSLARGSTSCKLVVGNRNCAVISEYLED